jgi:hypothetical protein
MDKGGLKVRATQGRLHAVVGEANDRDVLSLNGIRNVGLRDEEQDP